MVGGLPGQSRVICTPRGHARPCKCSRELRDATPQIKSKTRTITEG
jgi:hypothetical protein